MSQVLGEAREGKKWALAFAFERYTCELGRSRLRFAGRLRGAALSVLPSAVAGYVSFGSFHKDDALEHLRPSRGVRVGRRVRGRLCISDFDQRQR